MGRPRLPRVSKASAPGRMQARGCCEDSDDQDLSPRSPRALWNRPPTLGSQCPALPEATAVRVIVFRQELAQGPVHDDQGNRKLTGTIGVSPMPADWGLSLGSR